MSDSGLDKTNIHIDFDLGKVIYTVIKEQSRELLVDIAGYLGKNKNEMVRKYGFNDLMSTNIPKKLRNLGTTGGSTADPLRFWRDKESKSWG